MSIGGAQGSSPLGRLGQLTPARRFEQSRNDTLEQMEAPPEPWLRGQIPGLSEVQPVLETRLRRIRAVRGIKSRSKAFGKRNPPLDDPV
jgi:hypothetical protein